jgi:uncharacterized protein (TIGR00251 family)
LGEDYLVTTDRALIPIRVGPRSSRSGVRRDNEGELLVCVHSPAAEGAANRECVAVLAKALRMPRSAVRIVRGEKSRSKVITVDGLSAEQVRERLERAAGGKGATR